MESKDACLDKVLNLIISKNWKYNKRIGYTYKHVVLKLFIMSVQFCWHYLHTLSVTKDKYTIFQMYIL